MDTQPSVTAPPNTPSPTPRAWDDYFPLINKAILVLMLIFGILFGSGVDVVQFGSNLLSRNESAAAIVSTGVGSGSSGFSLSITGPNGWKNAIVLLAVIFGITVVALSVLSSSGRDAARMKEQEAMLKEDQTGPPSPNVGTASVPEPEECNLASYKLFFRSTEEPAAAETPAASTPA